MNKYFRNKINIEQRLNNIKLVYKKISEIIEKINILTIK